jgi:fumarate hydratase subunit beta
VRVARRGGRRYEPGVAKELTLPITPDEARALRVGDELLLAGRLLTARAAAHGHLVRSSDPALRALVDGAFLYHCGPVVARDPVTHAWRVVAAGPSTSMRVEPYEAEVIARYRVRGIVGKGGMGPATHAALREHGAVYLHAVGGLATALARRVTRVNGVHLLDELGVSEAIWDLQVEAFPAIVTMDAQGDSLHAKLEGEPEAARWLLERKSF